MTATPEEVFHRLVNGVSRLIAGDVSRAAELPELYAEQTRVEHPMALPAVPPLLSRDELRRHFTAGPGAQPAIDDYRPTGVVVHQTVDPEVIVAEFTYRGSIEGREFGVPCVFVMRVRDGQIVESRDYLGTLHRTVVRGGLDDLVAQLKAEF
jgi:ketosteroid isomerase-like protein